ncbi:MAG: MBL fold metallo-hydrolase [Deltaproteobacteria bacterium]|nr:MBL fold metallo-hydrolase [Deltaproteobacteria bacterium]MBW1816382.1 MBL fold metallo-hydrolase [Deltaproteobacteria bacterium]
MNEDRKFNRWRSSRYPHRVVKERLSDGNTEITDFFFRYGANVYVFSYEKEGEIKHTFIDTGYTSHKDKIIPIFIQNGINMNNIERIILTHRHPDHCGLASLLAGKSGGKVLAHANFRSFVEGQISPMERRWLGEFDPNELRKCNMEYLDPSSGYGSVNIGGLDFPRMREPIEIGDSGRLDILTCPESIPTHSPDQLIALYSPRPDPYICEQMDDDFHPSDEMIFSGDLWLMSGPIFERNMSYFKHRLKFALYRLKDLISGTDTFRRDPREQDAEAKEALKLGFCLVRVKPGHGNEFLGSNIIPKSLLADRDLLVKLGYDMDEDKSLLRSSDLAPRIADIRERFYMSFVEGMTLWLNIGYGPKDITRLLVRIYREQVGGGPLVKKDRAERRERLKETLTSLRHDMAVSDDLHQIAESTLPELEKFE